MTVSYYIDSKQKIVFTQVTGVVDGPQLHEHQNRLRDDPDFRPDMRELMNCIELKDAKLNTIFNSHLVEGSPWGSDSRRSIVVPNPLIFGLLRIFQTLMSDDHGKISIFRDLESANNWLHQLQEK